MNIYQTLQSCNGLSFNDALKAKNNDDKLRIYTISDYDIRFSLDGTQELTGCDLIEWFLTSTAADVQPGAVEVSLNRDEAKTAFKKMSDSCTIEYNEVDDTISTRVLVLDEVELEFHYQGEDEDDIGNPDYWSCEVIDEDPIDMFALDFGKK